MFRTFPKGPSPKYTDVSPWYGVYEAFLEIAAISKCPSDILSQLGIGEPLALTG
jgi:hypothetical protein